MTHLLEADTLASNNQSLGLLDRWHRNVPSLPSLSQEHARHLRDTEQLRNDVKAVVDAAVKERDRKDSSKEIG